MIVLIDDEHGPMDLYVEALRIAGFEVMHLDTVNAALQHIETAPAPADLYILDHMVPPGLALHLEAAGFGFTSGVEIYRRLRSRFATAPVIMLTSESNPAVLDALPIDENTTHEAKIHVLPFELVEKVKEALYARA